jgi:hypothetical protein
MEGGPNLLADGDTGWHIRAGDWILDHHRLPTSDFFSFTKSGQPWLHLRVAPNAGIAG